jgi:hypothetical protein
MRYRLRRKRKRRRSDMALNVIAEGSNFYPFPVPIGTKSGDPRVVADVPCVALVDRFPDGRATLMFGGIIRTFVIVNNPSKSGDFVYYDDTLATKLIAESGGVRTRWGIMAGDLDASGFVRVKLLSL